MYDTYYYEEIDSTQTYAINLLQSGLMHKNTLIYAKHQTSGIGRRGENWLSLGKNLTMSLVIKIQNISTPYSIICGIIVVNILKSENINAQIKWPNDIFLNGKKCGGIITNIEKINGINYCIFGIGINLLSNPDLQNKSYKACNIFNECNIKLNYRNLALKIANNISTIFEYKKYSNLMQYIESFTYGIGKKCKHNNEIMTFTSINNSGFAILKNANNQIYEIKSGQIEFIIDN